VNTCDAETASQAWDATAALAARFQVTVYAAACMELAVRLGIPMATLDHALRAAAVKVGVPLLDAAGEETPAS
jgi:predicted nucleic acid-binding protein